MSYTRRSNNSCLRKQARYFFISLSFLSPFQYFQRLFGQLQLMNMATVTSVIHSCSLRFFFQKHNTKRENIITKPLARSHPCCSSISHHIWASISISQLTMLPMWLMHVVTSYNGVKLDQEDTKKNKNKNSMRYR